ncbi:anti-sigma factor [Aureisphaera galaxeae]|uniref:anti-sigma factor n=1 Tax=Aureisphaera galaxeae TaxID=1538023 RepID=UPI00235065D5|nr:anti-sigma factor [Aureisphaera galaxeae]MDC8006375.1 anti-sigma factor [Aureisphaera galaxeae]
MKKMFLGILSLAFVITSCSNDDDSTPTTSNLTLNINGLEDLGADFNYEGWLLVDGNPVSTGLFTVDANGNLSSSSFEVPAETAAAATKFILTIEPNPDPDPAPSDQKFIAGDFNGDSASVSTSVAPAIGNFSNAAGDFFLRTPTDEAAGSGNNGNDQYGVWFGQPGMPPAATLVLPELPTGWIYEGWVIGESGPLSTGTFASIDEMDDNAGLATSFGGTENAGPPLPGEDFFNNAPSGETFPLDIRGRTVVITVEPVPDNSPAPFTLKPLAAQAGTETAPSFNTFALNLGTFPTGTVTR